MVGSPQEAASPEVVRNAQRGLLTGGTMAYKVGLGFGGVVAALVGSWFVYITATAGHVAEADLALLGGLVALCFVVAAVLGLAADISGFFPGLGVGFCLVAALASLVSAIISAFNGWGDAATRYAVVMLALVACFFVVRAIAARM
jgi:hypothetical protein